MSKDIQTVRDFIVGATGDADDFGPARNHGSILLKGQFRSNNSTSRAVVLMLAAKRPRSLLTRLAIDTAQALSQYNKKQFHHIYPIGYLKQTKAPGQHNALANICMLPAADNNLVSDSDPHVYLPDCANALGSHAEEVFKSNFLPSLSVFPYASATYGEFLSVRSGLLDQAIENLCSGQKL